MGVSFRCVVNPKVPSVEVFVTDGENLAMAYIGTLMGGLDLDGLMEESLETNGEEDDTEDDTPTIFSALDTFIDKSGGQITGIFQQWYPPADGLAAIADTLAKLRSTEGIAAVPDEEVREGCIFDLETYAKMLERAQSHGSLFVFSFDV